LRHRVATIGLGEEGSIHGFLRAGACSTHRKERKNRWERVQGNP
jgi:hypothetical protein